MRYVLVVLVVLLLRSSLGWDCCRICLDQSYPDLDTTYQPYGSLPASDDETPAVPMPHTLAPPPASLLQEKERETAVLGATGGVTGSAPIDPDADPDWTCCNICEAKVDQPLDNIIKIETTMEAARFASFQTDDATAILPPCCDFCAENLFVDTVELSPANQAFLETSNRHTKQQQRRQATQEKKEDTTQSKVAIHQKEGTQGKDYKKFPSLGGSISLSASVNLGAAASLSAKATSALSAVKNTVSSVVAKVSSVVNKVTSAVASVAGSITAAINALPLPQLDIAPAATSEPATPPPPAAELPALVLDATPTPCCHRCSSSKEINRRR